MPRTFAISCGSQTTVVTPCGRTASANRCGGSIEIYDLMRWQVTESDDAITAQRDRGLHDLVCEHVHHAASAQQQVSFDGATGSPDELPEIINRTRAQFADAHEDRVNHCPEPVRRPTPPQDAPRPRRAAGRS